MGIPGLIGYLRKHAPESLHPVTDACFRGKRVGIDVAIVLYKGVAVEHAIGDMGHLRLLVRQVMWFRSLDAVPVYVFDGEHPPEKAEEAARRRAARERTEARLADAEREAAEGVPGADERAASIRRQLVRVTRRHTEEAKRLLETMGVPVATAPGEAERALAVMQRAGAIDAIMTEDTDTLVCGAREFVKDTNRLTDLNTAPANRTATLVRLDRALSGLGLSYDQFVTACMLAGCDFVPKLPGMGPATAVAAVRRSGTADVAACLRHLARKDVTDDTVARYERCRPLLCFDPTEEPPRRSASGRLDIEALRKFCGDVGLDPSVVEGVAFLDGDFVVDEEAPPAKREKKCQPD